MTLNGQRDSRAKYSRASAAPTSVARRKWSDWSECSESCLRTRHRLNCDDLATLMKPGDHENNQDDDDDNNNNADNNLPSLSENSTSKQVVSVVGRKVGVRSNQVRRPTSNRDQSSSLRDDQDDQDYADEGDEDDEDDSCAQVETSKTFEEQNCFGGQCKLLPVGLLPNDALRPPTGSHQINHHHQHHQAQPWPAARLKGNGHFGLSTAELEAARHSSRHQIALPSGLAGVSVPPRSSPAAIEVNPMNQAAAHHNVHLARANSAVAANKSAAYFHSHSENRARVELVPAVDSGGGGGGGSSEIWATRSMWPLSGGVGNQMGNSTLVVPNPQQQQQQQYHLLQLTILIAALLSLVLFVALLIRRLFAASRGPVVGSNKTTTSLVAHNWMMAKSRQDQRQGGGGAKPFSDSCSSASSSNCRSYGHETAHHNLLESSPSGRRRQQPPFLVGQRLPTAHPSQQPLCYLWERKRASDGKLKSGPATSFASSLSHLAQQFGPSKSQKLFNGYGKQPQLFVSLDNQRAGNQQILHTQLEVASGSMSARPIGLAKLQFDPLYIEPAAANNSHHSPLATYNQNDYDYDTLDDVALTHYHKHERAASLACRSFTQLTGAPPNNKQPPNVPQATGQRSQQRADTEELSSRSPSASSSLSVSSMQSATAQLVSNNASGSAGGGGGGGGNSSSLDQTPEIVDCLQEPEEASTSAPRPPAQRVDVAIKRRQFKLSNDNHSTRAPDSSQTGGACDSGEQQQQHFYEEIGRG